MYELTRTIRSALFTVALAPLVLAPGAASADTITQSFSISLGPPHAQFLGITIPISGLNDFDPAQGTLTSVTFNGAAGVGFIGTGDFGTGFFTGLFNAPGMGSQRTLFLQSGAGFGFFGSTHDPAFLALYTGSGTVPNVLVVLSASQSFLFGDAIANGTLQYDFTPAAAVPEPSTWAMMLIGFAGLGFVAYRSRQRIAPRSS